MVTVGLVWLSIGQKTGRKQIVGIFVADKQPLQLENSTISRSFIFAGQSNFLESCTIV